MNCRVSLVFSLCLLPLLVACPSGEGLLDTQGVGIARYQQDYNAQLGVVDYSGPARYELASGALPQGLSMDAAGRILGAPEWAGVHTFEVGVAGLRGIADFTGSVTIDVRFDQVEGLALGVERTWLNNFFHDPPIGANGWGGRWDGRGPDDTGMFDPWTRLAGTGVEGMDSIEFNFGIYLPGENGRDDQGGLDDVRIGDIPPGDLTVVQDVFEPVPETDPRPGQGYPSGHYAEGDDAVYDEATGTFTAGVDTGEVYVTFTHPSVAEPLELRMQVSAPDWCPDPGC
jgi:hypothetical protein